MMNRLLLIVLMISFILWGTPALCPAADAPAADVKKVGEPQPEATVKASSASGQTAEPAAPSPQKTKSVFEEEYSEDEDDEYDDDPFAQEQVTIADPIEPFNRAMHVVNDKLYFWLLKPVAQGYKVVVPEPARISVKNFFFNIRYPARLVSCLLQTDFEGAATETGRFFINTVWGIGGLMDPAAGGELNMQKQDTDLGQTLGVYGVGHGFYIVWPFYGPSSPRDTVDILGNQVLNPLSFLNIWYTSLITKPVEVVNSASLHIGDYEAVVEASLDPYIAIRNGYIQYRLKDIQARKAKTLFFKEKIQTDVPAAKE